MKRIIFSVAIFISSLVHSSLNAQPIWLDHGLKNYVAIEILKPNFRGDSNLSFITSALFLSGRFAISERIVFVSELPLAHAGFDNDFGGSSDSETAIGNPYFGFEVRTPESPVSVELGLRLPVIPEDKFLVSLVGSGSDFGRFEAFRHDLFLILGKVDFQQKNASNVFTRIRFGPTIWLQTGDDFDDDTEIWFDVSIQTGYQGTRVNVMGGLTGRMLVSEEDLNFGERTFYEFGATTSFNLGKTRPGIHLRAPIDENLDSLVDFVVGLNLAVQIQ